MEVDLGPQVPSPEGNDQEDEGVRAAEILAQFPDEIWTIIFGNLRKSSKDLLNCTRVCTNWERILKEDQCTWLIDQVCACMGLICICANLKLDILTKVTFVLLLFQVFPFVFPYLEKKSVLAAHQVCSQWRKAVTDLVENHEDRQPFDESHTNIGHRSQASVLNKKSIKWNNFYERENLLRFMNVMGPSTAINPVFGRALWLEFQEESETEDQNFRENSHFWPTAFEFLATYGHQIWYFAIGTYGSRNTYVRFIHILHNCLKHLPNLKSLHIFGWINEMGDDEPDNLREDQIPAYLVEHPLPTLPVLETMEIVNMSGLPNAIQDHLITLHAPYLKSLQISEWEESRFIADHIQLPQLKELLAEVSRYRPMDKVIGLLTHLASSPIGRISLSFSSLESTLDLAALFQVLDQFGNTLQSLRLTVIPGVPRDKVRSKLAKDFIDNARLSMNCPNLRALHLEGFDRMPLTFLENLTALEYLEIRPLAATVRQRCYSHETIDLYQYLHSTKLYDSRIWSDLPNLKAIYYEVCNSSERRFMDLCFSRQAYEYLEALKPADI